MDNSSTTDIFVSDSIADYEEQEGVCVTFVEV